MNARLRAFTASLLLLALPVAEFARDGDVSETSIGALLILAFGGGGFAADKAVKAHVRRLAARWAEEDADAR